MLPEVPWSGVEELLSKETIDRKVFSKFQRFSADDGKSLNVVVVRSMPFEPLEPMINGFLSLSSVTANYTYSGYDPAFSEIEDLVSPQTDLVIFWIDWRLYSKGATYLEDWIVACTKRVQVRGQGVPILVNGWLERSERHLDINNVLSKVAEISPGTIFFNFKLSEKEALNERLEKLSGFPFSNRFCLNAARYLGCEIFPALAGVQVKAVILDLDNTLYSGVLGEDGPSRLEFSEAHRALWAKLRSLHDQGIVLSICSKNEQQDVDQFFRYWAESLPLRPSDFFMIEANWKQKSENVGEILRALNVGQDAVLFVDDNPNELLEVNSVWPNLKVLRASADAAITLSHLSFYPGFYRLVNDQALSVRLEDLKANRIRSELESNAVSKERYLAMLGMTLTVYKNHFKHLDRVFELANKTNQFNTALTRPSLEKVNRLFSEQFVFSFHLKDAFSDSGVVGAFLLEVNEGEPKVLDVFFSCRALGRGIEFIALREVLSCLEAYGYEVISIDLNDGPKNMPARKWLGELNVDAGSSVELAVLVQRVKFLCESLPVTVIKEF